MDADAFQRFCEDKDVGRQNFRDWVREHGYGLREAWEKWDTPPGLCDLAGKLPGVDLKQIVRAACACVRKVIHLAPAGDESARIAIETDEAWLRGEATIDEVCKAQRTAGRADSEVNRRDGSPVADVAVQNAAITATISAIYAGGRGSLNAPPLPGTSFYAGRATGLAAYALVAPLELGGKNPLVWHPKIDEEKYDAANALMADTIREYITLPLDKEPPSIAA